ncbi:ferredoxin [Kitasatospora sp. MY 5-36]|uniref:ferredoxin n=1 Tax=Kitasatospora sp. MY 5-36 TaxID=1678027 RepID=UPI00067120A3|nr:ferredoxin [Kitasatospora sp. MY 5-36]
MKIVVDLNRCQGYAQCAFLAPRVFELHGEEALMYTPQPPVEQRERVLRAAAACPVQAILVEDRAEAGAGAVGPDSPGREGRSGVR